MPRGGAHFSSRELVQVLSHYDVGVINQVTPLVAGNKRAPKVVIVSERGKFLLKRRPRGKDDLSQVCFAHSVQLHLSEKGFPVTALIRTSDGRNTFLQLHNHIYEFFRFAAGSRYDGSAEEARETGRQLALFHLHLSDFRSEWVPARKSFHDSYTVHRHLKMLSRENIAQQDQETFEKLTELYIHSSECVNELGFGSWPQQVVHGDWHPGNMLFLDRKLSAVFDFDSVKISPAVTDLANGMLQFSIVGDRPNPVDWPDYLDQAKLIQFLVGYMEVTQLASDKLGCLPDLMIEAIIAEAALPVAATGFFGNLGGGDFLKMILRKAAWIEGHREKLLEAMGG